MNRLSSLLARPSVTEITPASPMEASSPLLMVGENKKSGLILCKDFHAEFAGPGAALCSPVEQSYKAVIAIGSPEIVATQTSKQRARAYGLRIQWSRWLHSIADQENATDRVAKLLAGLEEFFGRSVVMNLPTEVLALLVGVFPRTVEDVKAASGYGENTLIFPCDELKVTHLSWEPNAFTRRDTPLQQETTLQEIHQTYSRMLRSA